MSEDKKPELEKKPGLFKRLFGFGKSVPDAPQTVVETIEPRPLVDEHAARIAAEIEEAKLAAAEADRLERETQKQERKQEQEKELEAKKQEESRRATAQKALDQQKIADAAALEAEKTEAIRQAQILADEQKQELASQEAKRQEAAKLESERLNREQLETANVEAIRLEDERIAAQNKREAEQHAERARSEATPVVVTTKTSWWQRLKGGLSRTANTVSDGITSLFTKRKLDGDTLEELEDILIQADLGIDVAARIAAAVGKGRYDKEIEPEEVKAILAEEVAKVLAPVAKPLTVDSTSKPFVILMVGVNGSGKTTTIGKLSSKFRAEGKSVMLAAGDTFRAAAIEQLKVWGDRTGTTVISRDQGADSSGLAFDALKAAKEQNTDVLLIDTAGRLQNRMELMAELEKMVRVIKKVDATAPHAVLLVLDATVGQNALSQVEIFGKVAGVTGLVMTKLDGTARGGILVAIAEKFTLPVHFIGVGEGIDDLEPFSAQDFARAIAGLEQLNA
jgi:fused signal recognition particle receptor